MYFVQFEFRTFSPILTLTCYSELDQSLPMCLRACVPACLRACVPACLRACVPACLRGRINQLLILLPLRGCVVQWEGLFGQAFFQQ
jgi:hypothetical protein